MKITPQQLTRLQTIYSQWARRFLFEPATREARLREMSERCGQTIASASDLTNYNAKALIDSFQAELGIAETQPPKRAGKSWREKLATEGRHDQIHSESTIVCQRDIDRIQRQLDRLGWNQARLEAFLASPSGPNGRRTQIRTLADANRVYWALKHFKTTPTPKEKPAA